MPGSAQSHRHSAVQNEMEAIARGRIYGIAERCVEAEKAFWSAKEQAKDTSQELAKVGIRLAGGLRKFARRVKRSPTYVSFVANGHAKLGVSTFADWAEWCRKNDPEYDRHCEATYQTELNRIR